MTKIQNSKQEGFGYWNIEYWNLFGIWDLDFKCALRSAWLKREKTCHGST